MLSVPLGVQWVFQDCPSWLTSLHSPPLPTSVPAICPSVHLFSPSIKLASPTFLLVHVGHTASRLNVSSCGPAHCVPWDPHPLLIPHQFLIPCMGFESACMPGAGSDDPVSSAASCSCESLTRGRVNDNCPSVDSQLGLSYLRTYLASSNPFWKSSSHAG